jgi:SAM-dependent methyltransferase
MFSAAMDDNLRLIGDLVASEIASARNTASILDLGCWDGATAGRYLPDGPIRFGVELQQAAAECAARRGFRVVLADLNVPLPLAGDGVDLLTSNQVLEHLHDTDSFVGESFRVLKPGGLLILSTENLASWHNILSLTLGWQAFSLTNVTQWAAGLGNPLANLRGEGGFDAGWQHHRIFSHRGLKELLRLHGFTDVEIHGSGYYPLPARFAKLDPRHAAFVIAQGRKPSGEADSDSNG